jgi:hypothetical protein
MRVMLMKKVKEGEEGEEANGRGIVPAGKNKSRRNPHPASRNSNCSGQPNYLLGK